MYVTGPRAKPIPVLTTAARAKVTSATAGPWDLNTGGRSLRVVVDGGNFIVEFGHIGEDVLVPGDFTVALPAEGAALNALFANSAAATAAEIVAWLNGSKATFTYNERDFLFSDRAIAYVEGGKVSIRTRAVGSFNPTVQIPERISSTSADSLNELPVHRSRRQGCRRRGSGPQADQCRERRSQGGPDGRKYQVHPRPGRRPGRRYVHDQRRVRRTREQHIRRSRVLPHAFRQGSHLPGQAGGRGEADGRQLHLLSLEYARCRAGVGFVLDPVRHNKPFNAQAVDQCAGCHNYKSGETVAARTWTTGGGTKPISKRVHAVHMGANLNYPVLTVDHEESVIGRNWQINYPMDIRNCESCHSAATSGAWKTKPNRLACMGCHDSDQATAHMKVQLAGSDSDSPWSGDEKESCAACH